MNIEYLLIQCFLQCVETWNLRKQQIYYRNRLQAASCKLSAPAAQAASLGQAANQTSKQAHHTTPGTHHQKTTTADLKQQTKQKKTKKEGGEKKKKKKRLENVKKCE